MKRLFQFVALLLLALWLPVTLHCDLEAAELWSGHDDHADAACCTPGLNCTHDGCDTLEGAALKAADTFARAPLPTFLNCVCLICLPPAEPTVLAAPVAIRALGELAMDWMPTRHFARRSAPLSRAPSPVGC